ncbi:MAG: hypothetical protein HMLKMBBP_03231 [Planctomycetes bacterium]|nr:hypothetical protein [Planctomycetota bacterium]
MSDGSRAFPALVVCLLGAFVAWASLGAAGAETVKEKKEQLQKDLRDTGVSDGWIYDDIDAGFARAAKEKKPVCIVFR